MKMKIILWMKKLRLLVLLMKVVEKLKKYFIWRVVVISVLQKISKP